MEKGQRVASFEDEAGRLQSRRPRGRQRGRLHGKQGQGRRIYSEDGDFRRTAAASPQAAWNGLGRDIEGPWGQSRPHLRGSQVPIRMRSPGDGRSVSAWDKRPSGGGQGGRRRVGYQPRDRQEGRDGRGRARSFEEEERGPDGSRRSCRGQKVREQRQERKESKEEEKKGSQEERGVKQRKRQEKRNQSPSQRPEEVRGTFCGNRAGPESSYPKEGASESKKVCDQEGKDKELNKQFIREQLEHTHLRGWTNGRAVHGSVQGPGFERAISGGVDPGVHEKHERGPLDRGWRGVGGSSFEASGSSLLSQLPEQEGIGSYEQRAPELSFSLGCIAEGPGSFSGGHHHPAHEVGRADLARSPLVRGTADGGPGFGGIKHGGQSGSTASSKGKLPGLQDQVPCDTSPERRTLREGREGQRKRRQGQLEGRRRQGKEPRWQGFEQEGRQEVRLESKGQHYEHPREGDLEDSQWKESELQFSQDFNREGKVADQAFEDLGQTSYVTRHGPVTGDEFQVNPEGARLEATDSRLQGVFSLPAGSPRPSGEKEFDRFGLKGAGFRELGHLLLQKLLEVLPLRSKTMGKVRNLDGFPLPTSRDHMKSLFPDLEEGMVSWLLNLVISLNSVWGDAMFNECPASGAQKMLLTNLIGDVKRVCGLSERLEVFDWDSFFRHRSIDYKGDEVKIAKSFAWANIAPALPKEVGCVPLADVCTYGAKYYVENFDLYIKPKSEWEPITSPKVMVRDDDWADVCRGLLAGKVCRLLKKEEVFDTGNGPLLNGLFGVTKDEVVNGVEVYRLIMNLVPLNGICQPFGGDIATLPSWSMMGPLFLQPSEQLLVSSEDVRCFFYIMSVPEPWCKYLAFGKLVPREVLPPDLVGEEVYLAAQVLPMGFLNSVSLAQHVHRNLARARGDEECPNRRHQELRKDKPFTVSNPQWRVYLDNFDLLERVKDTQVVSLEGSCAPNILALRQEYERWGVPRNTKKTVLRSTRAEVQGAQVDGVLGVAYPREQKMLKYIAAALTLCHQKKVSQRQVQVVCGGLVYISMFRRPLLGCLNQVWQFIESFSTDDTYKPLPPDCCHEIYRFLGLIPLARMDFRLSMHPQVTCSDASSTGGGMCASVGLTRFGQMATKGKLRGEVAEKNLDHAVLSIGLFDGIGALRVALDLLEVEVLGHISVEKDATANRVLEAAFPGCVVVEDVRDITLEMVHEWSLQFSQASVVIIGAGPPCQGVSGLNADRLGALKDQRSNLFGHVGRVKGMVQRTFVWAQVHVLMESVASMDRTDQDVMSADFGEDPWKCDAGTFTWCSRPRLYWISWGLLEDSGVELLEKDGNYEVKLTAEMGLELVCKKGWIKCEPERPFPTFTTSRPRPLAGRKPAGLGSCSPEEVERWQKDEHRFPPYQYANRNCLVNKAGVLRLPDVEEREFMLGFPVGYTNPCLPKGQRNSTSHTDVRLSLLGNSWSVPVVAWFLGQLLPPLGLCKPHSPQAVVDKTCPNKCLYLQSRLLRTSVRPQQTKRAGSGSQLLNSKIGNLISIKGEDIMLNLPSSQQVKFHRLRASVPSKLWVWKIVSGWAWKGSPEHINSLELRAVLTTLKWRILHRHQHNVRFLHLTDSLVCLHALARGRSSSRKLRRTLSRINALLLVSGCQALWAYVHTDSNPADKPSRWGRRVKTKFRNA